MQVVLGDFGQLDAAGVRQQLALEGYHVIVCNPPYRSEAQQEAYDRASGVFGGHTEDAKTLVAGKTGLEMYEAVAACIARDAVAAQGRTPGPLLLAGGTLIFQVEAGERGKLGGISERVGSAVERASGGKLVVTSVHTDEGGVERALLVKLR